MKHTLITALTVCLANTAFADIAVTFTEGAPKDRFSFTNDGTCPLSDAALELDLSTSPAGLIFDTTARGAGVEVFQPLEFVAGANALTNKPAPRDGATAVTLALGTFAPGETIAFTVDIDDTTGGREITVSGSEINGARVVLRENGQRTSAPIGSDGTAVLKRAACLS